MSDLKGMQTVQFGSAPTAGGDLQFITMSWMMYDAKPLLENLVANSGSVSDAVEGGKAMPGV